MLHLKVPIYKDIIKLSSVTSMSGIIYPVRVLTLSSMGSEDGLQSSVNSLNLRGTRCM